MTTDSVLAAALALMAALLAAVGTLMRQRATGRDGSIRRGWVLGAVVSVGAFGLQVAALVVGTVLLVQPLIVLSVLFELLLQKRWTQRSPTRRQWANGAAVAVGVAIFIAFARPVPAQHGRQLWVLDVVVLGFLGSVLVAYLVARRMKGNTAGLLFGVVAGSLFGLVAVQVNSLSEPFRGLGPTLANPTLYFCILTAVGAIAAQQRAFASGSLEASYPAMVASEPVVAMVLSLAVLGEKLSSHSVSTYLSIAGVAVMILGVIGLARATARLEVELTAQDETASSGPDRS